MLDQGVLNVQSAEQVMQEREAALQAAMEQRQNDPVILSLASELRNWWDAARDAKREVEQTMLASMRQRQGKYTDTERAEIEAAGGANLIYVRLTDEKANAAEAWLEEILLPPDDKPWAIEETPIPEIGPELQAQLAQMAAQEVMSQLPPQVLSGEMQLEPEEMQAIQAGISKRAANQPKQLEKMVREERDKLEREIEDALIDAGWRDAFREVISDMVTYKAGFLKGPLPTQKWVMERDQAGKPTWVQKVQRTYKRVSPFDMYPSPLAKDLQDGFLIERHVLTRRDLKSLQAVPGYDAEAIRAVLMEYGEGHLRNWLTTSDMDERERTESSSDWQNDPEGRVDALQCWGWVQGKMLKEWGREDIEDESAEYAVEAWLVGHYVIKAELNNHARGMRPYYKASFRERVGSFWGDGLPEIIADNQAACNAAARRLLDNMAIASGPQAMVDLDKLAEGSLPDDLYPWKVWKYNSLESQNGGAPIAFFQPNALVEQLLKVYEFWSSEADNKLGLPRYAYGTQVPKQGALGTASGLSMMLNASAKSIKKVVGNLDTRVISPSIKAMFEALVEDDVEGKYQGDLKIVARGASGLVEKQSQNQQRIAFLQIALASPPVLQLIGMRGLAELLRPQVRDLGTDPDTIIPTDEQITMQEQQQALMQQEQMAMENEAAATSSKEKVAKKPKVPSGSNEPAQRKPPITSDADTTYA